MQPARSVLLPGVFVGAAIESGCTQALAAARRLFALWGAEGRVLDFMDTPLGPGGDTRLCARFATPTDAAHALRALTRLGRGVDLFQPRRDAATRPPRIPR